MVTTLRDADADAAAQATDVVIYGAGGMGREVRWLAEACGYRPRCYADDSPAGPTVDDLPVLHLDDARKAHPGALLALAIGSPHSRERATARGHDAGFEMITLIHPSVIRSSRVTIGYGSVICAGTVLTTDVVLGDYVQVNVACTISHDVILGPFATLAPGVHVSGAVHIGSRVHLGTGSVVINGTPTEPITIGDDAIVGAGACVTRSVSPRTTVVGVPARPMEE